MRRTAFGVLAMVVLLPIVGGAQVFQWRTPPPPVTAQYASWQFNDEPIIVNSLIYHPTGERRFFDGQIMAQVGVYQSVPVYSDVTLEVYSVVYVPIGRNLMRGYERRREGEIAGTVGSRTPSFPVDIPTSIQPREEPLPPMPATSARTTAPPIERIEPVSAPLVIPTRVETVARPSGDNGIWVSYNGSRWYSRGSAASFDPNRFTQIGEYRGFPVYRDRNGGPDEIWIEVVKARVVAPYARR